MTLQNGLIENDTVFLYCDTAVFGAESGNLIGFYPKLIQGLQAPFAIACSFVGARDIARTMESLMGAVALFSMDGVHALADACRAWLLHWQGSHGGVARLLIGSNFTHEGPQLVMLATDDLGIAKPFQAITLEAYVSSANESEAYAAFVRSGCKPAKMAALIDAQRAAPMHPVDGGPPRYLIGGAAVELAITSAGVESRLLHEWPDAIGSAIAPEPAPT